MQRILVIRGGAVGDMIVTLPALRALRRAFPRATIELLGNPSRAILAQHPYYVDRITDLERWDLYRLFNQSPTVSEALATFLSTCELILSYVPVPDEIFPHVATASTGWRAYNRPSPTARHTLSTSAMRRLPTRLSGPHSARGRSALLAHCWPARSGGGRLPSRQWRSL